MSYLGLDIGTSGCKAVVYGESGRRLAGAHRAYPVQAPQPGWAELDSDQVLAACREVIREAAGQAGEPVRALGVSSQGEAFTPVDSAGRCLGRAMVSSDSRAAELMADFTERFGVKKLYQITGHTPAPLFSLFKLLWLKAHEPEIWARSAKFLCFEDLLQQSLGLEPALGWSLAGRTLLFDVKRHVWSREILDAVGLDESRLARPLAGGTVAGEVSRAAAARFGLPAGVKVVCGGHDQGLAALGAGVCQAGTVMYAAGSVECVCPVVERPVLNATLRRNNLCCYDYCLPGLYCSVAYSLTGSNLLQYFLEQFGQAERQAAGGESGGAYERLLAQLPAEPTELLALPYFTPSGTPYFDSRTPGALIGWRLSTSKGEVLKALLEGVALEMRLNLELLESSGFRIERLIATGGGMRNPALVQLKADVLGRPLTTLAVEEAGCLGAARLAQRALGEEARASEAETAGMEVRPDPHRAAQYRRKFAQYRELYPAVRRLNERLAAVS